VGRQLQLATTPADEIELLRFIQNVTPIKVFQSFANSIEELWIEDWEKRQIPGAGFQIWPQSFGWLPQYAQTGGPKCPLARAGKFYVSNSSAAPIMEFSRSFLERRIYGRIYWAKDFSAPTGLDYDVEAFAHLADLIWRWIRKVGKRRQNAKTHSPYFLPDAWSHYGQLVF